MSGEAAERILAQEPDGSFVVRDSSDQHYIFSLTFKLNGFVRHVRIEHDQGKNDNMINKNTLLLMDIVILVFYINTKM